MATINVTLSTSTSAYPVGSYPLWGYRFWLMTGETYEDIASIEQNNAPNCAFVDVPDGSYLVKAAAINHEELSAIAGNVIASYNFSIPLDEPGTYEAVSGISVITVS